MITRDIQQNIKQVAKQFPAIAITGPRQSGKTTLVKTLFPKHKYVSLEDLDIRQFASVDPRSFLDTYNAPVIFDEIQRVPSLFSYLQTKIDETGKPGSYILTGSQNFLLMESISQSLAGRIAVKTLLPLSLREISSNSLSHTSIGKIILRGSYPAVIEKKLNIGEWYSSYIQTYLERDIRQIISIQNLLSFQTFLKLCAGRSGQILNITSLANDAGITVNTVKSWLSLLHSSYIITFLQPHTQNFNKRLIKSPKLYFIDTGLACYLLNISSAEVFSAHPLMGALFENWVISEVLKETKNFPLHQSLYYWRDKTGLEIDLLIEKNNQITPVEIKAGKTVNPDFFENLKSYRDLAKDLVERPALIYGGDENQVRQDAEVISWSKIMKWLDGLKT